MKSKDCEKSTESVKMVVSVNPSVFENIFEFVKLSEVENTFVSAKGFDSVNFDDCVKGSDLNTHLPFLR